MTRRLIRYVITIALLAVVWRHAHWSVALALTLIAIAQELQEWFVMGVVNALIRSKPSEVKSNG